MKESEEMGDSSFFLLYYLNSVYFLLYLLNLCSFFYIFPVISFLSEHLTH